MPTRNSHTRWTSRRRAWRARHASAAIDTTAGRAARALPEMTLGNLEPNSIAPAVYGLVERGATKRPEIARELRCQIELRVREAHPPVRITFRHGGILVEDAPLELVLAEPRSAEATAERHEPFTPDLVVEGSLGDILQLTTTPLVGGLPHPMNLRGWSALAAIAGGRVSFRGNPLLVRQLMKLLQL